MNGNTQAKMTWDTIPKRDQMLILNNIFCTNCRVVRSISDPTATLEKDTLIIVGVCTKCNNRCARLVEVKENSKNNTIANIASSRCARIIKLASYAKSSTFYNILQDISPLKVFDRHLWKLSDYELFEKNDKFSKEIYAEVIKLKDRPCWEMEQILPGIEAYADELNDPILEGIEIHEEVGFNAALEHFKKLITVDSRCLDAYAHMGHMYFHLDRQSHYSTAKSYYKQGVAIALQAIGNRLNDVFLWGIINNRPFLRCLEGFGLCLLKQNKIDDALDVFRQMLLLNPLDNQGVRFMIADHIK